MILFTLFFLSSHIANFSISKLWGFITIEAYINVLLVVCDFSIKELWSIKRENLQEFLRGSIFSKGLFYIVFLLLYRPESGFHPTQ